MAILSVLALLAGAPMAMPREPIALLVVTPTPTEGSKGFARAVERIFEASSTVDLRQLEPRITQHCSGDLGCLALRARRDVTPPPKYLLVVSYLPGTQTSTPAVMSVFVDAERVDRIAADLGLSGGAVPKNHTERAVLYNERSPRPLDALGGTKLYARKLFDEVKERLDRPPRLAPPGAVVLRGLASGDQITVDGVAIGRAQTPEVEVVDLPPGEHAFSIARTGGATEEVRANVDSSASVSLSLASPGAVSTEGGPLISKAVVTGTGLALIGIGLGIAIYGIVQANGETTERCITPGPACATSRFIAFGFDPAYPEQPGSGPMVIPLAASLAMTGGAWTLGAQLFGDDNTWLPLLVGLALGGATYGAFAAIDAAQ